MFDWFKRKISWHKHFKLHSWDGCKTQTYVWKDDLYAIQYTMIMHKAFCPGVIYKLEICAKSKNKTYICKLHKGIFSICKQIYKIIFDNSLRKTITWEESLSSNYQYYNYIIETIRLKLIYNETD